MVAKMAETLHEGHYDLEGGKKNSLLKLKDPFLLRLFSNT